jgi:hypothetical protein
MSFISNALSSIGNFLTGGSSSNAQTGAAAADPFASQRPQYQAQLSSLMANPSSVSSLPGYQFQFQQGLDALQRTEAASGRLGGGGADIAAVQYGQNYANNAFSTYEQMLAQLSGATIGSPGTAGTLLTQGLNTAGQAGNSLLSSLLGVYLGI